MSLIATKRDRIYTLIAGVVVVAAVAFGFVIVTGGGSGHTVYAQFADAQFLVKGNTVNVNGVTAGKVDSLSVDRANNTAMVKLSIDNAEWPLHKGASASVRPVTILGEDYIDLTSGPVGAAPIPKGGVIPEAQTQSSTNLQSVLDSVNDPTASALALTISSLGQGMAGQGANASDAIRALAPALTDTSGLLKLLDGQNQLLNQMIDNVTPVVHSLNTNNGVTLNNLLTTTNSLLGATASSSNNLGADLRELPGTLTAATSTFDQLGNLADQATPALASITPLTDNLPQVSQELLDFSQAANPAVDTLQPLLSRANELIAQARPAVSTLQSKGPEGLQDLENASTILSGTIHGETGIPAGKTATIASSGTQGLNNLFNFIAEWASTTGTYDGTSHVFRFYAEGACSLLPAVPLVTSVLASAQICNQAGQPTATPGAAAKPASALKATALKPAATLKPATTAKPGLAPVPNLLKNTTGLVQNLLGGLLGGLSGGTNSTTPTGPGSLTGNQLQGVLNLLTGGL